MKWYRKKVVIGNTDGSPYMTRYMLLETRWLGIKLHHFVGSDRDCLHDHPWPFVSIVLKGGYWEVTPKENSGILSPFNPQSWVRKNYPPGAILFRNANHIHRIETTWPAWSLVFTFKRVREWGFWTKKGWTVWHKYFSNPNRCD